MLRIAPLDFRQEVPTFPRQSQPRWHEGLWPATGEGFAGAGGDRILLLSFPD